MFSELSNKIVDEVTEPKKTRGQIVELINNFDGPEKALTGRTPERISEETGIEKDLIFPADKTILYVGDPWQRMGREINCEKLTIIDYQFGEVASFITDNKGFLDEIEYEGEKLLSRVKEFEEELTGDDQEWIMKFRDLVEKADGLTRKASIYEDDLENEKVYQEAVEAWKEAKEAIETKYANDEAIADEEAKGEAGDCTDDEDSFAELRKQSWYKCVLGER